MTAAEWSEGAAGPVLAAVRTLDWQDDAACRDADPDLFFDPVRPEGNRARARREAQALAICARCAVRRTCLADAMEREAGSSEGIRAGIYGGLNEHERYRLDRYGEPPRRRAPRPPKAPSRPRRRTPGPAGRVIAGLTPEIIAGFWARTRPGPCGPEWALSLNKDGFGLFRPTKHAPRTAAHRIAYTLHTGRDPGADIVIQSCGNRRCLAAGCLTAITRPMPGRAAA